MTKQIEVLTVTLSNPSEVREFRGQRDSRYIEGVLIVTEPGRVTGFPIHRIAQTVTTVEDSE